MASLAFVEPLAASLGVVSVLTWPQCGQVSEQTKGPDSGSEPCGFAKRPQWVLSPDWLILARAELS